MPLLQKEHHFLQKSTHYTTHNLNSLSDMFMYGRQLSAPVSIVKKYIYFIAFYMLWIVKFIAFCGCLPTILISTINTNNYYGCSAAGAESGASYSLYVVGGNGVLVRHLLQPHKLDSAPEGDDAPIMLVHHAQICWRLLG